MNYSNSNKYIICSSLIASLFKVAICLLLFSIQTISWGTTDNPDEFTVEEIKSIILENTLPAKDIADIIINKIDFITSDDLSEFENLMLNSQNLDTGEIGLKFINSDNKKLHASGLELISDVCTSKTGFFQPNSFHAAFQRMGLLTEPFIVNIIRNTDNDFCREWACEVYAQMFCKIYADKESRQRLIAIHKKEEKIYTNLKKFFKDPEKLKKLYETQQSLGNVIRSGWGKYNRYPLRLLAIIHLLDNHNRTNHDTTVKLILEIIDSKTFDYNLLSKMHLQAHNSPLIPDKLRLRYLAKAVFINDSTNTFQWLPQKRGGFTEEELKLAIGKNDKPRIHEMQKILHQFICALLMKQLINGDGNREINLLKKFHFATWDKKLNWDDRLLTIHNKSNNGVALIMKKKADIDKILTGNGITSDSAEERNEEFYIASGCKFVWFVPSGNFQIDVNLKKSEIKNNTFFKFETENISIIKSNLTLNIY